MKVEAVRCVKIQRSREIKYYFMGKETNESSNRISRCYIEGEMRPILCNALKKLVQIQGNWVNVGIKNRCSKIERIYDHLCVKYNHRYRFYYSVYIFYCQNLNKRLEITIRTKIFPHLSYFLSKLSFETILPMIDY